MENDISKDGGSLDTFKGRNTKRDQWGRKSDYILTILGYLVGFGNIWRFPYICMKNGGGAFLIPYVLTLFLMVIPVYFLEVSLGQFSGKSYKDVWSYCPLIKGMGLSIQIMQVACVCYYIMLMSWVMNYMYHAFQNPLPWSICGNKWNTPDCFSFTDSIRLLENISTVHNLNNTGQTLFNDTASHVGNGSHRNFDQFMSSMTNMTLRTTKGHSAEEEFWQYKVLDMSAGLEVIGSLKGNLVVCLVVAWLLVYLCVIRGIRSTGKVVYLTATLPYLLLTIMLVHNLTLPGSFNGIMFFIKPDFKSLMNVQVWLEAAIQVFYSVTIGWGIHITLASFNKFNNNCLRDTFIMTIAGESTSVFGGFVIFSALGFMSHEANVPLTEVAKSGPGLGFVAYPMAIAQMPLSNLWAVLFFVAMITLGLDSQFTITEIAFVYFEESFPFMKKNQMICRACLSLAGIVFSLPLCTQTGVYLYQLIDWYLAAFGPLFFTLVECTSLAWLYGAERFSKDVEMMIGREVPGYIKFCWSFLSPLIVIVLMVTCLVSYVPPTYGDYVYPSWVGGAGWVCSVMPIIPFLIIGLHVVYHSPGKTVFEKLHYSVRPSKDWKAADDQVEYVGLPWKTNGSLT